MDMELRELMDKEYIDYMIRVVNVIEQYKQQQVMKKTKGKRILEKLWPTKSPPPKEQDSAPIGDAKTKVNLLIELTRQQALDEIKNSSQLSEVLNYLAKLQKLINDQKQPL